MPMRPFLLAAALVLAIVSGARADGPGLVVKPSAFSVAETLDRLERALAKKGIRVFARIDHAAGAKAIGARLAPTQVLIFGNPKLGTPLMQSRRTIAIDLPMKVLAWRDDAGKVWLAYNDPAYLARRHGIADRDAVLAKMAGALKKLSDAATKGPAK